MLNQTILPELKHEVANTRRMLERIPFDNAEWKPHAKSFALVPLANHVAELVSWVSFTLSTDGIDWANMNYKAETASNSGELLALVDKNLANSVKALEAATDEQLMAPWTMRSGEQVYFTMPRIAVIRTFALNHMIHHRAQLSVYLRLLDVAVPGMYGPTADEA
ncbi:MAG: hypothetical protein EOO08_06790 [Chitinophagaceae bacterium]|nr:MAG: hypothetical protein EOO08_06790 [Chitinophagaceae bacterium]